MLIAWISQKCINFFSRYSISCLSLTAFFFLPPKPQSRFFKLWENVSFKNFTFVFFESQGSLSEISIGALNFIPSQYSNSYWCVTTSLISSIKVSNDNFTLGEGDSGNKNLLRTLRRIFVCLNFPKKLKF